jgi:hypothetical protein
MPPLVAEHPSAEIASLHEAVEVEQVQRRCLSILKRVGGDDAAAADRLDVRIATATAEFEQAFRLVHNQYVEHGYMDARPSGWRVSAYNGLPSTKIFVAVDGARVVATLTLLRDSEGGLPMDEIYAEELTELRARTRAIAEVSGLAIDPHWQQAGLAVLMRLVRMMVLYATEVAGIDDLCIAVNPHHVAFYRKVLQFRPIGGLKQYRKVNGAPAVALRLDLGLARELIAELRDGASPRNDVHEFLFGQATYGSVMDAIFRDLPGSALGPERTAYFLGSGGTPGSRTGEACQEPGARLSAIARGIVSTLEETLSSRSLVAQPAA